MSQLAEYLRHFFSLSGSPPDDSRGAETPETQAVNGPDDSHSPDTSPSPRLTDIKYVDYVYDQDSHEWTYVDTESNTLAEAVMPSGPAVGSGDWQGYCFVIVRKFPAQMMPGEVIVFKIVIKSAHLLQACEHVLGNIPDVSWNSDPLELSPELLLTFLPQLEKYEATLSADPASEDNTSTITSIRTLVAYLRKNYQSTLAQIDNLTSHGEITFDLLYAILVPRTVVITRCTETGEPRALKLLSATWSGTCYTLYCQGVEGASADDDGGDNAGAADEPANATPSFGLYQICLNIAEFKGTRRINTLVAFPIEYHSDAEAIRARLVRRGRKWAVLNGIHHVAYRGLATDEMGSKYSVNSRIMIDRGNFMRVNPNNRVFEPNSDVACEQSALDEYQNREEGAHISSLIPSDDMLLLATPVLYGFSLSDKIWLRFNVERISSIEWNKETFEGLVLPDDRKTLLRSLVEAHDADSGFDDFVRGKGQGLVINLFGPPGVGKTLSAEATSEHIRHPLYVVGSGDLGTNPSALDAILGQVFDVATCWNAIVLIDEADVFLEQRSLHNLERNAMVAVFLRHIEYYRGILFLTTNRISTFDEAFLSRIHVALHYTELSTLTKIQIWRAFLKKAGVGEGRIPEELVEKLAERNVNGRQIKNACRTATSLARSRGVEMQYGHLVEALDAMEEFVKQFTAMRG